MILFLVFVVAAAASFVAGKEYGARVEAKGLAEALKVEALVSEEYRRVVQSLKAKAASVFLRIKSYL